ncbi:lipopolysaccharide kinase InaA family protein [Calycomorphotria hydatis]|uniref:Lipopolysaccharide core heptose(I) kinase RfaP n=1 Tax=Calycomorphotria hydatis TaxID=2528027 RepID=A0A517TEN3_9PLAN|nr:lipopolysaccharide kinase InaA family protein [Calycomorphotria hydatis]QDT66832.1 Lipopolysaccharide core heptose(I) kinase RfaP [Calycomorphotria hydatis]
MSSLSTPELDVTRDPAIVSARCWINPEFQSLLERNNLASVAALHATQNGEATRQLETRENWRLTLEDENGKPVVAYLKKHRYRTPFTIAAALCGRSAPTSPSSVEAAMTWRLAEEGVKTMTIIAYGEQLLANGYVEAVFMTEELAGFDPLDNFLPKRFPNAEDRHSADFQQLMNAVCDVAVKFHTLGYNHRDFYTCHFFVKEPQPNEFEVHLIDLQRVQRWSTFRRRWIVKDLGQLVYSCPPELVGVRERMSFFKRYLGVKKLDAGQKKLARDVWARVSRMQHRLGPYRYSSRIPARDVWTKISRLQRRLSSHR